MNIMSAKSEHWTDEQLIEHLYGMGPANDHVSQCAQCAGRFAALQTRRQSLTLEEPVSDQFLAAQRRSIYARLSQPYHWWQEIPLRRWAAAAATLVVLSGSALLYQDHRRELAEARADVELAQEVSQMSFESEPQATAPLKGLFIE